MAVPVDPALLPPLSPSPAQWLAAVLADLPAFLCDHASCEKKASGMALNIAAHYPDRPVLLRAMTDLAVEELSHWREVMRLLLAHAIQPRPDDRDAYVNTMQGLIRRGPQAYLLDRLLVAALIERRGAERFARIGEALAGTHGPFAALATFYQALASSESRHWELFLGLAAAELGTSAVLDRLGPLHHEEHRIMSDLPPAARLH